MIDHELQLWEYSAKELDLGEHRHVERHLEDCPECVEQLAAVEVARRALELAKESSPRVDWARADERIGALCLASAGADRERAACSRSDTSSHVARSCRAAMRISRWNWRRAAKPEAPHMLNASAIEFGPR